MTWSLVRRKEAYLRQSQPYASATRGVKCRLYHQLRVLWGRNRGTMPNTRSYLWRWIQATLPLGGPVSCLSEPWGPSWLIHFVIAYECTIAAPHFPTNPGRMQPA